MPGEGISRRTGRAGNYGVRCTLHLLTLGCCFPVRQDWRLYIVQEYCDGGPLRKLVQSQYLRTESGPNVVRTRLRLLKGLEEG